MKPLSFVLVLALAGGGAYYFYFKDHPVSWMRGPELAGANSGTAAGGKKDFKDLCARLQGVMDRIPTNLRDARQIPTYALDTRSKVAPHVQLHAEYTTVIQACDLIIDADQMFAEHQQKCGYVPVPAGASPQERARLANGASPAVHEAQQVLWNNQRLQADVKVRQLLAGLENRRL